MNLRDYLMALPKSQTFFPTFYPGFKTLHKKDPFKSSDIALASLPLLPYRSQIMDSLSNSAVNLSRMNGKTQRHFNMLECRLSFASHENKIGVYQ